jgi:small-conductance mechanosensitive channel
MARKQILTIYSAVSGQIGKVESIGLRFTILITFNNQKIIFPIET